MVKKSDSKLITCIVPKGEAKSILGLLASEKEVNTTYFYGARKFKFPGWVEVEVVKIAVSTDRAEGIFDYICELTKVDSTPGIIVHQGPLPCITDFSLSDFKIN